MQVSNSNRKGKRFVATFKDGTRVHFGQEGGKTYIDGATKAQKQAYLARHGVNEDWTDPKKASTLSRYITWGDYTSIDGNIASFKRKFGV